MVRPHRRNSSECRTVSRGFERRQSCDRRTEIEAGLRRRISGVRPANSLNLQAMRPETPCRRFRRLSLHPIKAPFAVSPRQHLRHGRVWRTLSPMQTCPSLSRHKKSPPRSSRFMRSPRRFALCDFTFSRSDDALSQHRVGHLQEARNVRAGNVVAFMAVFRGGGSRLLEDAHHDLMQARVNLV